MKISEVKKELRRRLRDRERLVDCYIFANNQYVMTTTISRSHVVRKRIYKINENADDPYERINYITLIDCI